MDAIIQKFNQETWIDFFEAIRRFYEYIDEDLLEFVPFSEEQLADCWEENLEKISKRLVQIINSRLHRREAIDSKKIIRFFQDTLLRCNGLRRRDTTSDAYLITKNFIDEDKLRDIITKNPHKGWNPFMLCNWIGKVVPCIFQPSRQLRNRYDFITVWYNPDWSIASAYVDTERLKDWTWAIYINEEDILDFYYWLYHPYVWWLVQSKRRWQLIMDLK